MSAGFDIAAGDPLGGMAVTPAGFGLLTASLMAMAERTAAGRLALVLEGGYDLRTLRDGVREVLKTLAKRDSPHSAADGPLPNEGSPLPRPGSGRSEGQPPCGGQSPSLRVELEDPLRTFRRKWDIPAA